MAKVYNRATGTEVEVSEERAEHLKANRHGYDGEMQFEDRDDSADESKSDDESSKDKSDE